MSHAQRGLILKRVIGLIMLLMVFGGAVQATQDADTIVLVEAIEIAKKAYGGKVVKADKVTLDSGTAYRIRLVNNGHVKEVLIDVVSGVLLHP